MGDMIYNALDPITFSNPALTCTRVFGPRDWLLLFFNVAAWLPTFDWDQCYNIDAARFRGGVEWDWERSVRMVTQRNAFEVGGCMGNRPAGLRNGGRIWRCEIEMETP